MPGRRLASHPREVSKANAKQQVVRKVAVSARPAASIAPEGGRHNDNIGVGGVSKALHRPASTDKNSIKEGPPSILNCALGHIRARRDAEGPETRVSGHLIQSVLNAVAFHKGEAHAGLLPPGTKVTPHQEATGGVEADGRRDKLIR